MRSQFAYPIKGKLIKLIERAGLGHDRELVEAIDKVSKECKICLEYRKPVPTPAVGLPHAVRFNETVAMDLKFFKGHIILHMIDHLTRFSAAVICKSKEAKEIIAGIFKCWIGVFGPPERFLTDNGGEFANYHFLELAEKYNIRVMTTAAESPWSNGLVERHNATLAEMLHKVWEDADTTIENALAWTIQAKNNLTNVHGFSPAQLALGYNPQVPTVMNSKLPALEEKTSSDIINEHLTTMKLAREAFIRAESSERIKRALRHNVTPGAHNKFLSGDIVYYKRNDSRKWKGPGRVIGSESSNVLIKHGSNYVRVHACRVLMPESNATGKKEEAAKKLNEDSSKIQQEKDDSEGYESEEIKKVVAEKDEDSKIREESESETQAKLNSTQSGATNERGVLKKGTKIIFKPLNGSWDEGTIVRRTGKATGKYKDYWEIQSEKSGERKEYNIVSDIEEWKVKEEENTLFVESVEQEIFCVQECLQAEIAQDVKEAKTTEVENWKRRDVYEEVLDEGQERLSTTWVITSKNKENSVHTKARLVVRGYEEDSRDIRSDSPTCLKDNVRMLLTLAVANEWTINTIDIKAAFLQGKNIERTLHINPPKEFRRSGYLWKLKKVVYGLCDASRSWYLKVCEVLAMLGMKVSTYDGAVFRYGNDELEGVMLVHVDDILFFGSAKFLKEVIEPFKEKFQISREERCAFKYLGVELSQYPNHVILGQKEYLDSMKLDLLPSMNMRDRDRYADKEEQRAFKQGIGQLGWITSISKPEGAFSYCVLSTVQSNPQIADFVKYKKAVRDLKNTDSEIKINRLRKESLHLIVFSDASFGNLPGGGSQLGYIVYMRDGDGNSVPITWASKRARRVARSTLTAETLAAVEAVDAAASSKAMLEEILRKELPPLVLYVDNKSLYETAQTSNVLADKRLLIDMSALREMVERREVEMRWISSDKQLADVLTKAGANRQKLVEVNSTGKIPK